MLDKDLDKYYDVTMKKLTFTYEGHDLYIVTRRKRENNQKEDQNIEPIRREIKYEDTQGYVHQTKTLYFKKKMIYTQIKKYNVWERLQTNFCLCRHNCIINGVEYIQNIPYLIVTLEDGQVTYIDMLAVEAIEDAE